MSTNGWRRFDGDDDPSGCRDGDRHFNHSLHWLCMHSQYYTAATWVIAVIRRVKTLLWTGKKRRLVMTALITAVLDNGRAYSVCITVVQYYLDTPYTITLSEMRLLS